MAVIVGKPIKITRGRTRQVDGNGKGVSDHFNGHAADYRMSANGGQTTAPFGDKIMEALRILGRRLEARCERQEHIGRLFTFTCTEPFQCIWKTDEGGNHHTTCTSASAPA